VTPNPSFEARPNIKTLAPQSGAGYHPLCGARVLLSASASIQTLGFTSIIKMFSLEFFEACGLVFLGCLLFQRYLRFKQDEATRRAPDRVDQSLQSTEPPRNLEHLVLNFSVENPPDQIAWKFRTDGTGGSYFYVDLAAISCTCESFTRRRCHFAQDDVRRFCGHLIRAYQKSGTWPEPDGLIATLFASGPPEGGCWPYDNLSRTQLSSGEFVYFGDSLGREWTDVFAKARRKGDVRGRYTGAYGKYGFNMDHRKWSYGSAPPGAGEIRLILRATEDLRRRRLREA
jgi:hypothetical protein